MVEQVEFETKIRGETVPLENGGKQPLSLAATYCGDVGGSATSANGQAAIGSAMGRHEESPYARSRPVAAAPPNGKW